MVRCRRRSRKARRRHDRPRKLRLLFEAYAGLEFEVIWQLIRTDLAGNRFNLCSLLLESDVVSRAEEQVSDVSEQASSDVNISSGSDAHDTW